MEILTGIGTGVGILGVIFLLILGIFIIMMPFMVYFAQNYAHQCLKELQILNDKIEKLINEIRK